MVPDHFFVVQNVYAMGSYNLSTHEGQARFVDDVVWALHLQDRRWGHLKKSGSATNIHGHAEDAALYLSDTPGQSTAVDFIAGAGTPTARIAWQVDTPRYSQPDWLDPTLHDPGVPVPPPVVSYPYPDEPTWWSAYTRRVAACFAEAGRRFPDDPEAFRWFSRCGYDCAGMDKDAAADKHIAELRKALGLP